MVVKADGLALGKGVIIASDRDDGQTSRALDDGGARFWRCRQARCHRGMFARERVLGARARERQ